MLSGIAPALIAACSSDELDDGSQQAATCVNYVQRLLDCELIAGHRVSGCADDDPILPCIWDCMQKATCKQIKSMLCDNAFNGYAGCLNECHMLPPPPFMCQDGALIEAGLRCNGAEDCANGEDEAECTQGFFVCDDGAEVPESWKCDGRSECADGSDERGCPEGPMITCDDGQRIAASRDCNGIADCAGGEDERDCASLTCD